jgi:hypothetical protein
MRFRRRPYALSRTGSIGRRWNIERAFDELLQSLAQSINPPPSPEPQRIKPTGWLGSPHFDAKLMALPQRWW